MRLSQLSDQKVLPIDPPIEGLSPDSRQIRRGWLFAALQGTRQDGSKFIADALRNGAAALLVGAADDVPANAGVPVIRVDNPARTLALMAGRFYARQPAVTAAVTGTNGKTSTVFFTQQLWQALGLKAASIGTLGLRGPARPGQLPVECVRSAAMTTPDAVSLMAAMADLAAGGVDHLAFEASSHGLSQYRLDGVRVGVAAFTNLTRDHLDYHRDMDDYFAAKARLFSDILVPGGTAVLNADIPEFAALRKICDKRGVSVLDYGRKARALKLCARQALPQGQDIEIEAQGRRYKAVLPLVGEFMVMNALAALGLAVAEAPADHARTAALVQALGQLRGAPGRLQLVPGHPKAAIYVDYAHTPDALENILNALRPHTAGKLWCVFGCGGDRDPGKRPIMGRIAETRADKVIITDDNPRSEDPARIRAAIKAAAPQAQEIGNRRDAIRAAVAGLAPGDVLVIAGKGHEQGQIIGNSVEPFDDVIEAQNALSTHKRTA